MTKTVSGTTTIEAQYKYDTYGQVTKTAGTADSDFQFAGYYVHTRSGLNLTRTRAYSSSFGRFINRDRIGEWGGINLYGYVENAPVSAIDPSGNASIRELMDKLKRGATACVCNALKNALDTLGDKVLDKIEVYSKPEHGPKSDALGGATYEIMGQVKTTKPGTHISNIVYLQSILYAGTTAWVVYCGGSGGPPGSQQFSDDRLFDLIDLSTSAPHTGWSDPNPPEKKNQTTPWWMLGLFGIGAAAVAL